MLYEHGKASAKVNYELHTVILFSVREQIGRAPAEANNLSLARRPRQTTHAATDP